MPHFRSSLQVQNPFIEHIIEQFQNPYPGQTWKTVHVNIQQHIYNLTLYLLKGWSKCQIWNTSRQRSEYPSERATHRIITGTLTGRRGHCRWKCTPLSFSYVIFGLAVRSFSAQASQSRRWPNYLWTASAMETFRLPAALLIALSRFQINHLFINGI